MVPSCLEQWLLHEMDVNPYCAQGGGGVMQSCKWHHQVMDVNPYYGKRGCKAGTMTCLLLRDSLMSSCLLIPLLISLTAIPKSGLKSSRASGSLIWYGSLWSDCNLTNHATPRHTSACHHSPHNQLTPSRSLLKVAYIIKTRSTTFAVNH